MSDFFFLTERKSDLDDWFNEGPCFVNQEI